MRKAVCMAVSFLLLCGCAREVKTAETAQKPAPSLSVAYFESLSMEEQDVYQQIEKNKEMRESFPIPTGEANAVRRAFTAFLYDHCEEPGFERTYHISGSGGNWSLQLFHTFSPEEEARQKKALGEYQKEILDSVLREGMTDWEKELALHDWLTEHCRYELRESDSAFGALVEGKAACEGYSKGMKLLLEGAGIPARLITGTADRDGETENHMWLLVQLDSQWYHLDPTWDDQGEMGTSHAYFNGNDMRFSKDHSGFPTGYCLSEDEDYFQKTGRSFLQYDDESQGKILALLQSAAAKKENRIEFQIREKDAFDYLTNRLVGEEEIRPLVRRAMEQADAAPGQVTIRILGNPVQQTVLIVF